MLQAYKIYMPDGYASIVRGLKSCLSEWLKYSKLSGQEKEFLVRGCSLSTPGGPELKKLLTLQRIIS